MNKTGKLSLFKTSFLATLLTAAGATHAAGLGKLTVYSAIGQPLNAEVAIAATPEELVSLSAKLASHDAFKEAGIEFMPALAGLRFSVAKAPNNQAVLKLTTERPLNEPFLHFLVELNWSSGRMAREYTFLLDPPEMLQLTRPSPVLVPTPSSTVSATPPQPTPIKVAPLPVPATESAASTSVPAMQATAKAVGGEFEVKRGDTLSKIARAIKPESVSLDQMLVALFNGNRDAFDANNMNRMHAGKILRLPDPADAAKIDPLEARKLIIAQASEFNAYRRRLADAAVASPVADTAPRQQASGKIKPQLEAKAPTPATKDKLEVSRTEVPKAAKAGSSKLSSLEEDLIARDKALREAAGRIVDLEKNLENLKHLVELKSQAGVQAQKQAQAAASKLVTEKAPVPKPAEPTPVPMPVVTPSAIPSATPTAEPVAPAAAPVAAAKPVEPVPAPVPAETPPPPKPVVKKPIPSPPPPPPPESSFVEENPSLVFGGGGLIALLLGYLGFSAWRKKKQENEDDEVYGDDLGLASTNISAESGAVFGASSESVDSDEVSIQGDFSEGGALTTEESVDPVAEADVYMAYGRDNQAEEILQEGLKTDPTRTAIHNKLLELYANRKNVAQFEAIAQKLHGLSGGRGGDWDKAVSLAQTIGLTGGLFAVAGVVAKEPAIPAVAPDIPAQAADATVDVAPPPASTASTSRESIPAAEVDSGSLDFDLDLGTTSGPAAVADVERIEEKSAPEEAMSLDFDFDLGTPEPAAVPPSPPEQEVQSSQAVAGNAIDFSLDIDTPAEPVVTDQETAFDAKAESAATDFDLDLGSSEEASEVVPDAVEFDIDSPVVAQDEKKTEEKSLSDLKLDFDLDLDAGPASVSLNDTSELVAKPVEPATLDLAEISLDLDDAITSNSAAVPLEAVSPPEVDLPISASTLETPDLDLALDIGSLPPTPAADLSPKGAVEVDLPNVDFDAVPVQQGIAQAGGSTGPDDPEVATKLELAQAYEEMGDREGARELLNEVLCEGSEAQQAIARSRLDQLDI